MKIAKMSLVAALLIGTGAFAVDNVKISGDANLFYTTDDEGNNDLFNKDASAADASLNIGVTADLVKNDVVKVSAGAKYTVVSTLGLENNFVSGVWADSHNASNLGTNGSSYPAKVDNANWMSEAWVAATAGKTTLKLGRMELDTPLAFTEKWSAERNTFEGIVAINQDIPGTTLVAAWVGNGNGTENFGAAPTTALNSLNLTAGGVVNTNGKFQTYGSDGAYALGVINNSIEPLTVQAWYYNVAKVADAYWLQADVNFQGILAGAQYTGMSIDKNVVLNGARAGLTKDIDTNAYAVMLGYEMKDVATVKVSYSDVDKDFNAGFNTATNAGSAQSKLYTEAWWSYGYVTQADTSSYTVSLESPVNGIVDLGLYYTDADQSKAAGDNDLTEATLTLGKSFGPLDATLAYIYTDTNDEDSFNTIQAYLTLNF